MRRFTPDRFVVLILCGLVAASVPATGQETGRARVSSPDAPPGQSAGKEPRPEAAPLNVPAADPQLDRVLTDWHNKTQGIKKLQGVHRRFTFESTFQVVKVSEGKFYYEAPDKGRIDLASEDPQKLEDADPQSEGVQIPESGQKKLFTLKPDQPEQWICDGTQIMRIDNAARTYEVSTIPEQHRGTNIMDGPLPFLFGLPPDKAKQRYAMTLVPLPPDRNAIYIVVTPLLSQDAANWQRADVMLDATTYLPTAVKLLDPSGNRVTLFSFNEHKTNAINILSIFGVNDPFKPVLIGYQQVQSGAPEAIQVAEGQVRPLNGVPAVVGLSHGDAMKTLMARGYPKEKIQFIKDKTPSAPKLRWHVKTQNPPPNAPQNAADKITLTLYVTAADLAGKAQQPRQRN